MLHKAMQNEGSRVAIAVLATFLYAVGVNLFIVPVGLYSGGYSLAGLFALWAATQTNALYGVAAASPSVWFPGWPEYEAAHPIQAQRVYLSLGDREEHTKNQTMASVGDNIRALHTALTRRGTDSALEWNAGGHFKDIDLRTARAFAWVMEGKQ